MVFSSGFDAREPVAFTAHTHLNRGNVAGCHVIRDVALPLKVGRGVARCCTEAWPLQTAATKVDEWIAVQHERRTLAGWLKS